MEGLRGRERLPRQRRGQEGGQRGRVSADRSHRSDYPAGLVGLLGLLDDPIAGMEKLAPYVLATHVKDLMPDKAAKPTDWHFFAGVPVGKGLINNQKLAELLHKANFKGFLAVEIDHPHTDWTEKEDEAVALSIKELKRIASQLK